MNDLVHFVTIEKKEKSILKMRRNGVQYNGRADVIKLGPMGMCTYKHRLFIHRLGFSNKKKMQPFSK
jgi:hypothetical protein